MARLDDRCTTHVRRSAQTLAVVLMLLIVPISSMANIWADNIGQRWFYETGSQPDEALAGVWWESSLEPGTYNISFNVELLEGRMALYVGDSPMISITDTGTQSFEFVVVPGGKRRMMFTTLSSSVVASVSQISVTEQLVPAASEGAEPGHYLSFSRERNLKTEVMDVLDHPSGSSNYHRNIAQEIDAALRTPGVKGFAITIDWRTVETGDGVFNWRLIDDNARAAQRYGLTFVVKILDRSFDGANIMPGYFPSRYVLWTTGNGTRGFVAKRWEPYVYTRIIRLYRAIANRYRTNPAFAGIATTESAVGDFNDSSYSVARYRTALTQIVTQTQTALTRGKLFWYLNFIRGDHSKNMNLDGRVDLVSRVPHGSLVVGGPDITPDVRGMPGSVNSYRKHIRDTRPSIAQFCHAQHVDLGLGGRNTKTNQHRRAFLNHITTVRQNESRPGFNGTPAVFVRDDLSPAGGADVFLHPTWQLGDTWQPAELFSFARRNFGCDYFFWNYRRATGSNANQSTWLDVRPTVVGNQYFYLSH